MTMRGSARRAIVLDVRQFGWDRAAVSALRHSTLPWHDRFAAEIQIDATPLRALKEVGSRDRLSLVGQFAAHLAFLQFAGVRDGAFDADEWVVARKRATDCRLLRVSARRGGEESPPMLTSIQEFAKAIAAPPLHVLRQSWGRAETAYHEVESRLRADAAADLRWLRRSAGGSVAAPGIESLRDLLLRARGRFCAPADVIAFRALAALDAPVEVFGDEVSPVVRYSAIGALRQMIGPIEALSEREIVERVVAALGESRRIFVLTQWESFDNASRHVVDLLQAADVGVWIGTGATELPETSWFVLSPVLDGRREIDARLAALAPHDRGEWIQSLVQSPALTRYLDDGEVPPPTADIAVSRLQEPLRSYVAAVALLGCRVPKTLVDRFLERLLSSARATDLVIDGICSVDDGEFSIASEDIRRQAINSIPAASRVSLCRVAAEVAEAYGDRRCAAFLMIEAGDVPRAAVLLESIDWRSREDVIRTLRAVPRGALTERSRRTLAEALIDAGRYRDAREFASEPLLARIERRMGDYAVALARLERLHDRDFDCELLRAELFLHLDRQKDVRRVLDACQPSTDDERLRLGYERAVLALDTGMAADDAWLQLRGHEYYAARIAVYRAIVARDLEHAIANARTALAAAATVPQRMDATLDFLFALFCSGDWVAARAAALDALLRVEETQGDRAAGAILFMLAYLSADDGQWTHATHLLGRLRSFYGEMRDEKRLAELEMLAAAIDFSRGRFTAAQRAANAALTVKTSDQIGEAAALILDEIDWMQHHDVPLRSTGATANMELTNRHALLRARRGLAHGPLRDWARRLVEWEVGGGLPPPAANGSEKLMLLRAAFGRGRKDVAERIAAEFNIVLDSAGERAADSELRVLRAASALPFPFAKNAFMPTGWRYATRNRLGQWQEIGSLAPLASPSLDAILAAPTADWIACSERELLYIEDLARWSSDSRDAIASLFRVRAEHHRLRKLLDEDPSEAPRDAVEGIVGESPAIREIYGLIARVAKRDVPVCILGESGTGKELVARAMHRQSPRRHKPFTAINCAALPENLIESELFGHARGAFTGADRDRAGLIETTEGGTLFLDEIGEMPLAAQAKLLRFLQEGEFRRVGETVNRTADVRVVTATNRKLEAAVEQGRFREDLYYRVRGVEMILPPLRDRASDIPLLASHFLTGERQKHRGGPSRLSAEVEAAFASYHWPGNVRELQNTIRAAHALAGEAKEIDLEHLPNRLQQIKIVRRSIGSYQDAVARFRRELIEKSLAQANGNQNQAASLLKISRQALAYQIRELGILVTPSKRPGI
jgi:DNA-binding NtrC family response regulator